MKQCPHCRQEFGLGTFLTRYGSDTLLKHSPKAHPHEHECEACRHRFWVHYDPEVFQRTLSRYAMSAAIGSVLVTFFAVQPAFGFDPVKTFVFILILLFLLIPFGIAYSRYQSAVLKEER